MLPNVSSGAAVVYRWVPSSGTAVASGLTTNWGACDARPSSYVTTILTNAGTSGCASDRHGSAALDPAVDMFFNTAYSQATDVQGNWYFGRLRDSSTGGGTFTFRLIYVYSNGTKAVLPGSASQSVSSGQSADFNVSLAGINGTVPANAKLGLRISKSGSSTSLRAYFGDTANNAGTGPSGYFSVTETPSGSSNTYSVNLKSSPASSTIAAGADYTYTIYVNNTGNTDGNYTLSVSDTDSSNFITPSVLGRTAVFVQAGGSNSTTLKVTAKSSAAGGAVDYTNVSAVSVENPSYSNSTTAATTIQTAPSPGVSVSLTPSSQNINKGGQVQYTVTVTNTGNVPDSYALSLNNGNTANFSYNLTQTSTGTLNPNASFNTIMTVTASAAAPAGASHTQSVRAAGSAVGDSGIVTTTVAGGGKIMVATNRFVILDDPLTSGKTAQTPEFALAPGTGWTLNSWSGAQTTIKSYALVLSEAGTPVKNSPVVFTVRNWNSADKTTSTAVNTDANGIASYSIDLNAKNYYGRWYVDANATAIGKNDTTGFIYNWWGCNAGGCRNHGSDSPGAATPSKQNSPYTLGREGVTSRSAHRTSDNDCVGCHRGYGGVGGGSSFTGQATKTADVHTTNTCASCHNITISTHQTDAKIRSCSDCHSWTNLTKKYTMSSTTPPLSNYSGNIAAAGHNPNSTIPCIICHGSFHNITKPDETLRLIKNSIVEDSQCLTCHTTYSRHNSGVGCTLCHSQDVHDIKVFSGSANYVSKGNLNQGNCTNCHQNSTFINSLKLAQKAGAYTGPDPAQVKKPLNHSSDNGGQKWGNFWNSSDNACKYCHSSTQHSASAIGAAVLAALGIDNVGDPIGTGTLCSSCHNSSDSNYNAINYLSVPPPAIIPGINFNSSGMDHTGFITDADCKNCHGSNLVTGDNMSMFTHNAAPASGGACDSCHKEPPDGVLRYNTQGAHTLHAARGYGNVPITGCDYCHASEGAHESGHPNANDNANVTTNASASIGTYVMNSATGNDDTCSGVSCHSNGLSSGARLGTAVWDSTTSGSCSVCHSTVPSGLPPTGNHTIHYLSENYSCAECHGTNADAGTQTGHKTNALIDINFTNVTGSINASKTCTVYCHSPNSFDPKPEPTWGVSNVGCGDCHSIPPAVTRNNAAHTTDPNCSGCHGAGASNGSQTGHINGVIDTPTMSCTSCHAQPPDGTIRYNMTGAHDLHKAAGYGTTANISCNYCHSNAGGYEQNHPQNDGAADVAANASVSMTYLQNSSSGNDDTCSGVSCHSNGLSSGAKLGSAVWDSTTSGSCSVCHSTVPSGLPPTGNHTIHYLSENYSCAECHGTNADAGTQTGHKTNALIDINFTNVTGSINASKTCTVYCHSPNSFDPKPEPAWGISNVGCGDCHSIPPAVTRNNAAHPASSDCNACHGTGAVNGTHNGHIDGVITAESSSSCTGCHNQVTSADLGLHAGFNGTSEADSGDCTTCHYGSIPMVEGAVNNNNTYFCTDCHTTAGTGPNKSSMIFLDKKHGVASCLDCHAADGTYHQNDPRGTVANSTYINRFSTAKNYTDCADCHYSSNLDDAPFNAPGGGEHIGSFGGACEGGCHNPLPAKTYIQAIHNTSVQDNAETPIISTPVLNPGTVNQGGNATVTAVVTITNGLTATAFVDGAQYRIMSGQTEIVPWTPMAASDGNFSGLSETASAAMNTSIPAGTYNVEVRGMGGGPSRDRSLRYYPMNGDISPVQSASLTII